MAENGTNFTDTANETDVNNGPSQPGLTLFATLLVTFQILIMIAILCGNVFVLAAIFRIKMLQDVTALFVANLAIADLITGFIHPFQIAFFFHPELAKNKYACLLRYEIILFACNASILSLICTVVDRYIAIVHPLRYPNIMTNKVAVALISGIWIIDTGTAIVPMFVNNFDVAPPVCLYILVMNSNCRLANTVSGITFAIVMFIIYIRINIIVRKHTLQIQNQTVHPSGTEGYPQTNQMNAVIAFIVLYFQLSWLPFYAIQLVMLDPKNITETIVTVSNFTVFLGILNSVVNPIIYAWKNITYRVAFKKLLKCKCNSVGNMQ